MTSQPEPNPAPAAPDRFEWHPTYRGRTAREVRDALREELESDQRQYALSISGAEQDEGTVLSTVVPLEKKWGRFEMDWAEADAAALADRVVAFEQERERRRELIPYGTFRGGGTTAVRGGSPAEPDALVPSRLPHYAWVIAALVVLALVLSLLVV